MRKLLTVHGIGIEFSAGRAVASGCIGAARWSVQLEWARPERKGPEEYRQRGGQIGCSHAACTSPLNSSGAPAPRAEVRNWCWNPKSRQGGLAYATGFSGRQTKRSVEYLKQEMKMRLNRLMVAVVAMGLSVGLMGCEKKAAEPPKTEGAAAPEAPKAEEKKEEAPKAEEKKAEEAPKPAEAAPAAPAAAPAAAAPAAPAADPAAAAPAAAPAAAAPAAPAAAPAAAPEAAK